MANSVQVSRLNHGAFAKQPLCASEKEHGFQRMNASQILLFSCTTPISSSIAVKRLSSLGALARLSAKDLLTANAGLDRCGGCSEWPTYRPSRTNASTVFGTGKCLPALLSPGRVLQQRSLVSRNCSVKALRDKKTDVAETAANKDASIADEDRPLKVQLRKKTKKSVAEIRAAALGDTLVPPKPAKLKKAKKGVKDETTKKKKGKKKATKNEKLTEGSNDALESEGLESLSLEVLLEKGQRSLEKKVFKEAGRYFSECICKGEKESEGRLGQNGKKLVVDALLGLSEALCGLSSFDAASAAASKAVDLKSKYPKALYRSGVAFLHLERYPAARDYLTECKASLETDFDSVYAYDFGDSASRAKVAAFKAKVDQALKDTDRCEKQSRGEYDLESFHTNHQVPHPVADYIGPVDISEVVGKGRGLTVTRDVKQGELLLVTKAVAVSSREGRPPGREVDTNAQDAQVAQAVYERVCVDPWVRAQVECMYDGTDRKLSVPSIELFRMSSYLTTYRLASLTPNGEVLARAIDGSDIVSSGLDLERIQRVKKYNAFSTEAAPSISGEETPSEMDEVGLWTLAGIINHSCLPTATYFVIGDVHFVFAVQDLPRGTEITQPYMAIAEPVRKRQRDTRLLYKFTCRCPRCKYEETHVEELAPAIDAWQEVRDSGAEILRRAEDEGGEAAEEAFRFFQARLDVVEATIMKVGQTETERNWLRAAYMTCYTRFERACEFVGDWDACEAAGLACLDAMESVNLYYSFAIQHAAEISELLLCKYGKESEEWRRHKQRVLRIVERSLNCVPKYALEAIEDVESFSKGECWELFSKDIMQVVAKW